MTPGWPWAESLGVSSSGSPADKAETSGIWSLILPSCLRFLIEYLQYQALYGWSHAALLWLPIPHTHNMSRVSHTHSLFLPAILAWVSLCNYTPPRSGCTSLCWYMDSVTKKTQGEGRLARLKMQLRGKELLELGYKTNKADKQATFGGDSVPCTPEIKNTL